MRVRLYEVANDRFINFNALSFAMKRYPLVLMSVLLVFVLAASVALASVALPPSYPGNFPPGPFISAEELEKGRQAEMARLDLQRRLRYCESLQSGPGLINGDAYYRCRKQAYEDYHASLKMIYNPPTLILPNGNSPGGN